MSGTLPIRERRLPRQEFTLLAKNEKIPEKWTQEFLDEVFTMSLLNTLFKWRGAKQPFGKVEHLPIVQKGWNEKFSTFKSSKFTWKNDESIKHHLPIGRERSEVSEMDLFCLKYLHLVPKSIQRSEALKPEALKANFGIFWKIMSEALRPI